MCATKTQIIFSKKIPRKKLVSIGNPENQPADTLADPTEALSSSGSSGRVRGGGHEIYAAAFGGHLFYDLFSQDRGEGAWPPRPPPGSATAKDTRRPTRSNSFHFHTVFRKNIVK